MPKCVVLSSIQPLASPALLCESCCDLRPLLPPFVRESELAVLVFRKIGESWRGLASTEP